MFGPWGSVSVFSGLFGPLDDNHLTEPELEEDNHLSVDDNHLTVDDDHLSLRTALSVRADFSQKRKRSELSCGLCGL